jgi:hypothetical protein
MWLWNSPDPDPIGTYQKRLVRIGHQPTCLAVQELYGYPCDCGRGWEHRSPLEQIRKRLASLWARRTELLPWWPYKLGYWTEARRQRLLRKINKL